MFPRYGGMTHSFPRRPVNPGFGGLNQFHFPNELQMTNFQRPIENYMGVMHHPMSIQMQPNQQTATPYLYAQSQPGYYPINTPYQHQQVNWVPVPVQMVQQTIVPLAQNPTQQQYWRANQINQFSNRFSSTNQNTNNNSPVVPNPWDPAMSTNVSSLISQSILTSSTPENSTNQEKSSRNAN
jgi:hypothetical protein